MALDMNNEITTDVLYTDLETTFPTVTQLATDEQRRRFELLRLAFFALKLRKLEQRLAGEHEEGETVMEPSSEMEFRCNLLRHAIFQQVVALIQLDARAQAMQIIVACQK